MTIEYFNFLLITVYFLNRFENMEEETKHFIDYLDQSEQLKLPFSNPTIKKRSRSKSSKDVTCQYFKQLTTVLIKQLEKKYYEDFLLNDYKPDSYYSCAGNFKVVDS